MLHTFDLTGRVLRGFHQWSILTMKKQLLAYRLNHTGRNCSSICINQCLLSKEYGENHWETTLSNSCQFFSYYFGSNRQLYYVLSPSIVQHIRCYSSLNILYFFSTMYYFHKQAKWLVTSIHQIDNKTTNISKQILLLKNKIHFPFMHHI